MKYPFEITINDDERASQIKDKVKIGHYFVFVNQKTNTVLPLVDQPVQLDGVTITPDTRLIDPIGCLVSDRDLYRAEQDTVYLFIAFPAPRTCA
jgi:hypothetical protein